MAEKYLGSGAARRDYGAVYYKTHVYYDSWFSAFSASAFGYTFPNLASPVYAGGGVHLRSRRADRNDLRNAIGGEALSG